MLRTDRLDAYYGLFQALFSLSFQVGPGETVALIGSNGAGKSTLLRSIVGSVRTRHDGVMLNDLATGGDS